MSLRGSHKVIEKTISSKFLFEGRAVKLRLDAVQMPDGRQTTREIVEHPDCVAVVPVDTEGNVLLVKQYRKSVEKELLEIPAGGIEPDEEPMAAVRREMQEETGFLPHNIERMGGFYSSPGFCTEYLHLFLATELVEMPLTAEDTAEITVVPVSPDEIGSLITSETIQDSKSIAGLLTYLYLKRR